MTISNNLSSSFYDIFICEFERMCSLDLNVIELSRDLPNSVQFFEKINKLDLTLFSQFVFLLRSL